LAIVYSEIGKNERRTWYLITGFLVLVIGLAWVFSRVYDINWLVPLVVIITTVQAFTSYWWSDKISLAMSGAHQIEKKDNPELFRTVENVAIAAGLPMPKVCIIEDPSPNAFATGRNPEHAAVAVTTGLLSKLEKPELEGVIAHEMSHVGNHDTLLMTVVVVLVGFVALLSDFFLRFSFFGFGGRRREGGGGDAGAILILVGLALAILSPIIATLIQLAISRKREFLADSDGALITGYPDGLARALEKISADPEPLEHANKATAHLYIASPLKDENDEKRGWLSGLFDTHPPIAERVKRLHEMNS
jgi:heat shock protein HtpX